MIEGRFYLKNYSGWGVSYFLLTSAKDMPVILNRLNTLKCNNLFKRRAKKLLSSGLFNTGLAYSNKKLRRSILVVSEATSVWEFLNSFAHEIDHLEKHIAKALNFSPYSETASYLVGEIIMNMFKKIVCKKEMFYPEQ